MTEKKKTGGYGIRALSGYDEEDSHFDVDVDYMRVLRKKHVKGNPVDPLKLKPGLVCKCWATNADDFYSTKVMSIMQKEKSRTKMTRALEKQWGQTLSFVFQMFLTFLNTWDAQCHHFGYTLRRSLR